MRAVLTHLHDLASQLPPASSAPGAEGAAPATAGQGADPAAGPAASSPLSSLMPLLMFGLLFLFMWFMVIRPERKRQKERQTMLSALKKGDHVITTAGLFAQVAALDEHTVTLKVGDDLRLKFERNAIARIQSSKGEDSETEKEPAKGKLIAAGK